MDTFEILRPILIIEHNQTQISPPLSDVQIANAEIVLGKLLPPSFREWLLVMGDKAYLFNGNLQIDPLLDQPGQPCIVHNLQRLNQYHWQLDPALIVFGSNGAGELWALDSAISTTEGEYPVVQVGAIFSDEGRNYKLSNSSFARFLYSQALWWTRYRHPALPEPKDESAEDNWIITINRLLDPTIELGHPDVYAAPQTMTEIRSLFG
ncbi:MAG: SMI1/KNR4 family protein [Chloroflexi bacterium]|nr:SMI1/KNR4 family protein [Chloroflexota bacterium]